MKFFGLVDGGGLWVLVCWWLLFACGWLMVGGCCFIVSVWWLVVGGVRRWVDGGW